MRRMVLFWLLCLAPLGCRPLANLPPEPSLLYARADDAIRRGDFTTALVEFRRFLAHTSEPTYRARAQYQMAQAHYGLKQYQSTLDVLADLRREFPDERWPQTAALEGDALLALGRRTDGVLAWEEAWKRGGKPERELLRERLFRTLRQLDESELYELDEILSVALLRDMVALHLPGHARKAARARRTRAAPARRPAPETLPEGELGAPAETLAAARPRPRTPPAARRPRVDSEGAIAPPQPAPLADEVPAGAGPFRAACLLQLSGPDKPYGARALSGLRLAFADAPESLLVRDTGGDPRLAVKLLSELAADPSVLAVIGPLRNSEARAAAPLAEQLRIPLVLLSQREGIRGRFVVQTSITRARQVHLLMHHATTALRAKRFGVLYPEAGYGRTFTALFRNEVERRGARLVGTKAYVPGQKAFAAEVATVQRWRREAHVDTVFIPDAAPTAAALGAALRAAAPDLILLGTESWNQPATIARAAGIEGAVFADVFFADSASPATRAFVERFREQSGRLPATFEAQAFDAAMLVRRALDSGARSRDAVRNALSTLGPYEGAGRLYATPDGFERELFLLRVRQGKVEEIPAAVGRS